MTLIVALHITADIPITAGLLMTVDRPMMGDHHAEEDRPAAVVAGAAAGEAASLAAWQQMFADEMQRVFYNAIINGIIDDYLQCVFKKFGFQLFERPLTTAGKSGGISP
jgi:N-methylhydantoinase B/oxoprolinase/acetone carboxylase alpha subunit